MNYNILRICKWRLVVAALFVLGVQFTLASNAPLVSGSYEVLQNTGRGAQAQIRMRIHLVNHGSADLPIQWMTLWDFSHPDQNSSQACSVMLHAHGSADTTREFTIKRSEYQLWQRGLRPRFVLQIGGPGNSPGRTITKSTTVVRLDRISGQEAR